MPVHRFVMFTGLGGMFWAGVFIGLGWLFSGQLEMGGGIREQHGELGCRAADRSAWRLYGMDYSQRVGKEQLSICYARQSLAYSSLCSYLSQNP